MREWMISRQVVVISVFAIFVILGGVWLASIAFSMMNLSNAQNQLAAIKTRQRYEGCFMGEPTIEEMEQQGWLKFPKSAKNPVPYSEDLCLTFYLRFEINKADLAPYIESTYMRYPLSSTTIPRDFELLPPDLGWEIKKSLSYWSSEAEYAGTLHQATFIDRSNDPIYIVYHIRRDITR